MAFKGHLEAALRSGNLAILGQILTVPGSEPGWEHARRILSDELQISDPVRALLELSGMLEKIALDVERSKAKDDERGTRIVDDYALVHVDAARDPFVQQTWEETRCLQREIAEVVARLEAHPSLNGKQPPSEIQIMIA